MMRGAKSLSGRELKMDKLKICSCMKHDVVSATENINIREAATMMVEKSIGTLPIVNRDGNLIGITTMGDIIQVFLPNFVSLVSDIDFVKDFGNLGTFSPESFERAEKLTITDIMVEPVAAEDTSSLVRALSIMSKHNIRDLPVLHEGRLVGIASRVDIGRAFLADWLSSLGEVPEV
jgi:CBS domain-containing protein